MKLPLLLPLLLTLPSIVAKPHRNSTLTTSQCRQLTHLQAITALSNNATALAQATRNNTAKASTIQAQASAAASTLATLETNTTLTSLCDQLSASEAAISSCRRLSKLERITALAANATTATDKLKAKAADQAQELAVLQGNATLTTLCAGLKTKENCEEMARLQRVVEKAANATEGKNSTRSQDRVGRVQAKLDQLAGNATLVAACAELGVDGTNSAQAAAAPSESPSGGPALFWPTGSMVALLTVLMSAVLVL
ncbi:hypothetical protein NKR19_g6278 [Coniochaeta hoffmannii]|uniref:Cell wall protein n=1 Tax=Coniochaeta hoffmannii TaxID=91930 RepID=A0AA38RYN5_9PEZI|nr:hypothetical protein NKR19_g6278 [Coniochaeta hoffmannii]